MANVRTNDRYYAEIAGAIREKNGTQNTYKPSEMAAAIAGITGGVGGATSLYPTTVTPTGEEFTKTAEEGLGFSSVTVEGDANLTAANIRRGVTIYGVTGRYAPSSDGEAESIYPVMELPEAYKPYVDYATKHLYSGKYAHLVVFDYGDWIAVSFLMDDFEITEYDIYTTEFKAYGWRTCGYVKSKGEWTSHNYTNTESPGENYARHIVFASCRIKYGEQVLFPVGVTDTIKINSIDFDDEAGTVTLVFATGQTEVLTWVKDASGNITGVTDSQGHTTTLAGVSA